MNNIDGPYKRNGDGSYTLITTAVDPRFTSLGTDHSTFRIEFTRTEKYDQMYYFRWMTNGKDYNGNSYVPFWFTVCAPDPLKVNEGKDKVLQVLYEQK